MNLQVNFPDSISTFASSPLITIARFMGAWSFPWLQGTSQNNFLKTEMFLEFSGSFPLFLILRNGFAVEIVFCYRTHSL